MEVEGVMAMQARGAQLEKRHRAFIQHLRSSPGGFNFSQFVREKIEEKIEEHDWEYQGENKDEDEPEKSEFDEWRKKNQY